MQFSLKTFQVRLNVNINHLDIDRDEAASVPEDVDANLLPAQNEASTR